MVFFIYKDDVVINDVLEKKLMDNSKLFYHSCLNVDYIEEKGLNRIIDLLISLQLDTEISLKPNDLSLLIAKLDELQVFSLLPIMPTVDMRNPDSYVLTALQGGFYLPDKDYYADGATMGVYIIALTRIFTVLLPKLENRNETEFDFLAIAESVARIERQLALAAKKKEEMLGIL